MQSILIFLGGILTAAVVGWGYMAMSGMTLTPAPVTPSTEIPDETPDTNTNTGTNQGTAGPQKVWVKDHYEYVVSFNGGIFTPAVMTIKKGETIQFVNKDNLTMRVSVAFQGTPASTIVDPKTVGKGGTYSYMFTKSGKYVISNVDGALNPGGGVVNVVD